MQFLCVTRIGPFSTAFWRWMTTSLRNLVVNKHGVTPEKSGYSSYVKAQDFWMHMRPGLQNGGWTAPGPGMRGCHPAKHQSWTEFCITLACSITVEILGSSPVQLVKVSINSRKDFRSAALELATSAPHVHRGSCC